MIFEAKGHIKSDKWVQQQKEKVISTLNLFDKNRNAHIPKDKVATVLRAVGVYANEDQLKSIIQKMNLPDDEDDVPYNMVTTTAINLLTEGLYEPPTSGQLLQAFRVIDAEKKGYITVENMKNLLLTNDIFSEEEIQAFITNATENDSDLIYYEDYISKCSEII